MKKNKNYEKKGLSAKKKHAASYQNVVALDVPVQTELVVHEGEGQQYLPADVGDVRFLEVHRGAQRIRQRPPLHEVHRDHDLQVEASRFFLSYY